MSASVRIRLRRARHRECDGRRRLSRQRHDPEGSGSYSWTHHAAGMWAIAGVGMAVGSGRFGLGVLAGVAVLLVFSADRVDSLVRRLAKRPQAVGQDAIKSGKSAFDSATGLL